MPVKKAKKSVKKLVKREEKKDLRSMIKKTVVDMVEVKQATYSVQSSVLAYTSTGWNAINNFPLTPYPGYIAIAQGTGQGGRIGNEIRIKKTILEFAFWPNYYSGASNLTPTPLEVIIWIYKLNNNDATPANLSAFFNAGDASVNPNGTMLDIVRPYNTDVYTVYKRIVKKLGYSNFGGTGVNVGAQSFANNDFKLNHVFKLDVTKYLPKRVRYNDTTTTPFTQMVNMAVEVVNSDGSTQVATNIPATMYFSITTDYTDM